MDLWLKLTDWLKENPWVNAVSLLFGLIGVIGVILSIIFFIKGRHTKEPIYAIQSTNLIQDFTSRFDSLEITYARERISNLTATKVAFWNNGKATINGSDIATADPLMIRVKNGYKILDSSVMYRKEDANQFKIIPSKDGSHVLIQFDYLDKGEGGVLQLLHTGKSSDDVEVCGTIKGVGKPKQHSILKKYSSPIYAWLGTIISSLCFVYLIYGYVRGKIINVSQKVMIVITGFLIMYITFAWVGVYLISKKYVPQGFGVFYE